MLIQLLTCSQTHDIPLSIRRFFIEPFNSFIKGINAQPNAHEDNDVGCNEQKWRKETGYPTIPRHLNSLTINLHKSTSEHNIIASNQLFEHFSVGHQVLSKDYVNVSLNVPATCKLPDCAAVILIYKDWSESGVCKNHFIKPQ